MMCEPLSLGAIFASVGSAFRFADLAIRVAEVGSENEVFVRTIRVVRDDLTEVERLLSVGAVQSKITSTPGKLPWVRNAIINTKAALNEIGKWVERARSEQEATGNIQFETRIRWVFNDHEKLINRKTELMTCHQQLSNVLSYLIRLEDIPAGIEPPDHIETTFFDDVLSRHRRPATSKDPEIQLSIDGTSSAKLGGHSLVDESQSSDIAVQPQDTTSTETARYSAPNPTHQPLSYPYMPPSSPPPAYNSVVRSHNTSVDLHADANTDYLQHNDNTGFLEHRSLIANRDYRFPRGFTESWAYQKKVMTPELPGDSVVMSGTNSLGPVDPFQFASELPTSSEPKKSTHSNAESLGELLGDLTFHVKVPETEDPDSPQGYPVRRTAGLPLRRPHQMLENQTERTSIRRSVPEVLRAMNRPGPLHTHSQPVTLHQADYSDKILSRPTSQPHHTFELESRPERPFSFRQIRPPLRDHDRRRPISDTPAQVTSNLHSKVVQPSRSSPQWTESAGYSSDTQSINSESSVATRMRRQKEMMNLLGSIE